MTIDEYLAYTRNKIGSATYTDETEVFYEQLQSIAESSEIDEVYLVVTNTCKAQCSTVYLDNKKYIIWDLAYWTFIEEYLNTIEIFLSGNCECAYLLYNYHLYQMLRYRVSNEKVRNALLEVEKGILQKLDGAILKFRENNYNKKNIFDFLKIFAFIHELFHIKLDEDDALRLSVLAEFDEYIQIVKEEKLLWFSQKSSYADIDFTEKINIDESIKQYENDDDIKIEVICDFYAIDSLAASVEQFLGVLDVKKEILLADFCCLKEAIIGFYNDVLYYQEYIERLVEHKTSIDENIIVEASKGFYDIANLYMARESLFNPLFLVRCFKKHNCVVLTRSSDYYDIYNKLNHKSLRNSYLKNFIDFYNVSI